MTIGANETAYQTATRLSFPEVSLRRTVSPEALESGEIVPFLDADGDHLGFQPLGISLVADRIAVASYFEPAIYLGQISRDEKGLHIDFTAIRGADARGAGSQDTSVRIFPDVIRNDANRAQTVILMPNGTILVSRKADREFFVLSPTENPSRPRLTGRLLLPCKEDWGEMLHAAVDEPFQNHLLTVESAPDTKTCWHRAYQISEFGFRMVHEQVIPPFTYGIGLRAGKTGPWFITDSRSQREFGIYHGNELLVPGICGNGLAFLVNGSALVTQYNHAVGTTTGKPGKLLYVPAALFQK